MDWQPIEPGVPITPEQSAVSMAMANALSFLFPDTNWSSALWQATNAFMADLGSTHEIVPRLETLPTGWQLVPPGSIPMPRNLEEAQAMNLLSEHYIKNSPSESRP